MDGLPVTISMSIDPKDVDSLMEKVERLSNHLRSVKEVLAEIETTSLSIISQDPSDDLPALNVEPLPPLPVFDQPFSAENGERLIDETRKF